MSSKDWFRKTTWTPEDEASFYARLRRARGTFHKAQYLSLQAFTLKEAGLFAQALKLYDEVLRDYPMEKWLLAGSLLGKAEALSALGDCATAMQTFRAAVQAQREYPNVRHHIALSFAKRFHGETDDSLVAELIALLAEELEALHAPLFPFLRFEYALALSRLWQARGDRTAAALFAAKAREAQSEIHSGFHNHPKLGLVSDISTSDEEWLRQLLEG